MPIPDSVSKDSIRAVYEQLLLLQETIGGTGGTASQVQGNVASGVADSGNPVKVGGVYPAAFPTFVAGQRGDLSIGLRGGLRVDLYNGDTATAFGGLTDNADGVAASATSNALRTIARNTLWNGTNWDRQRKANATSRLLSAAATTNPTSVKASAGDVFRISGFNANAAARFLKLYNKASAPTVGTDTPVLTEYLAPQAKFELNFPTGLYFSTGIAYALTTAAPDADTGALTLADIVSLNLSYA